MGALLEPCKGQFEVRSFCLCKLIIMRSCVAHRNLSVNAYISNHSSFQRLGSRLLSLLTFGLPLETYSLTNVQSDIVGIRCFIAY